MTKFKDPRSINEHAGRGLLSISQPSPQLLLKPSKSWGTYNIPRLAIYLYSLGLGVAEIEKYAEATSFQKIHPRGGDVRRPME